ncbi:MAG: glycosyltransferase family 4 protein [Limimaricola soesokkakensis]|uniref:glycosyltransferase family 4 protein n=1 Tax=Limimaricola soesokkakensis TaxID=1343159 RepID=UPI004059BF21
MKLVFFTRHEHLGASSRYRSVQYFELLREMGHEVSQHHFFSDAYLRARYTGTRPTWEVLRRYTSRLRAALLAARGADAVIVEKELFPFLPAGAERVLRRGGAALLYDFDDAIWHAYERHRFGALFGEKISKLVAGSDHVVVGSHYLADQVTAWGASSVSLVPTTIPASRYRGQGLTASKTADIVWIGSMSTGPHVQRIFPVIERLHRTRGSIARLIGFPRQLISGPIPDFLRLVPWSAATELEMMSSGRIGIMPLPDDPFERGKCGFKLVQYMGMGLPTIASPVGENNYIVQHGATGYLAGNDNQWYDYLTTLLDDPKLARTLGEAGHERFQSHYSTEMAARRLDEIVQDTVRARRSKMQLRRHAD